MLAIARVIVFSIPILALASCAQVGSRPDALVTGTLAYASETTLPDRVSLRVMLLDVSASGGAEPVAEMDMSDTRPPARFVLHYDARAIDETHRYVLQAQILADGRLLLLTAAEFPVITQGNPTHQDMLLQPPGADPAATRP